MRTIFKSHSNPILNLPKNKYGAHIFHTSNKEVWNFVNSIVEFNRYTNCPVANYHGELYNLPFNMNTFNKLWGVKTPEEAKAKIEEQKAEAIAALNGREPQNLEEQALTLVGKDIFEKLIREYTEKQWGRKCTELPALIIRRLPVRMIFDNNYFNDLYQGIPIGGYNKLIEGLLDGTETKTGVDFFKSEYRDWRKYAEKLVYTGAIDEYFDYKLGKLDWRTVSFKTRIEQTPNYQGNAVVNYTSHDEARQLCGEYDLILPKKRKLYIETVYSHYDHTFYGEQFDAAREIISRRCPEYLETFDSHMKERSEHLFNMFIMKADLFHKYCEWMFPILEELESRYDLKNMDPFQARLIGRVSERLLDVYVQKNNLKYKEIDFLYFGKKNMIRKVWGFAMAAIFHKRYKKSWRIGQGFQPAI